MVTDQTAQDYTAGSDTARHDPATRSDFADQTGMPLSSVIVSNPVAVAGIDIAAAVSITGGEYAVRPMAEAPGAVGSVPKGLSILTIKSRCARRHPQATPL